MAWRCSGRTNEELIDNMRRNGLIQSEAVASAMKRVDRKHYVPDKTASYEDSPQTIGFGATISAPHMHAHACENLLPLLRKRGERCSILDVGSGSGYLTAVFHRLAPEATVVGIDHLRGLVEMGKENLRKDGIAVEAADSRVRIVLGDGRQGYLPHAPYRVIHVGAAAPDMPKALIDQLDRPGRMFIPVGTDTQDIYQVDKDEAGNVTSQKLFGVRVSLDVAPVQADCAADPPVCPSDRRR